MEEEENTNGRKSEPAADIVRQLKRKLDDYRRQNATRAGWLKRYVPTGLKPLDRILPSHGLPTGSIVEVLFDADGVGAMSLSIKMAVGASASPQKNRQTEPRPVVVVDTRGDFYPPAAWQRGLQPEQLIVIRPRSRREAFWAADQCLRCDGVAATIVPLTRTDDRQSRKLQLAAESSGAIGIILQPAREKNQSFAAIRILVEKKGIKGSRDRGIKKKGIKGLRDSGIKGVSDEATERRSDEGGQSKTNRSRVAWSMRSGAQHGHVQGRGGKEGSRDQVASSLFCAFETGRKKNLIKVTLLKIREGTPGQTAWIDLDHETGAGDSSSVPLDRPAAKRA